MGEQTLASKEASYNTLPAPDFARAAARRIVAILSKQVS